MKQLSLIPDEIKWSRDGDGYVTSFVETSKHAIDHDTISCPKCGMINIATKGTKNDWITSCKPIFVKENSYTLRCTHCNTLVRFE
jgi:phage FluMu protein Com